MTPISASSALSITQGRVCREVRQQRVTLTETTHEAGVELPEHVHSAASMSLVLSGAFDERVAEESFECGPLSLLFKPPGLPHANRYGPAGARTILVSLDGAEFRRLCGPTNSTAQRAFAVTGPTAARALSLVAASFSGAPAHELEWVELFARMCREVPGAAASRRPGWLRTVDELVNSRFAEPLRLSTLAEAAGVDPVHLARVHRRHHGCSVGDAVRRRRIEHAIERFRRGSADLSTLALECGFSDQSHLTRAFTREVGAPPGRFRRGALELLDEPCSGSMTGRPGVRRSV